MQGPFTKKVELTNIQVLNNTDQNFKIRSNFLHSFLLFKNYLITLSWACPMIICFKLVYIITFLYYTILYHLLGFLGFLAQKYSTPKIFLTFNKNFYPFTKNPCFYLRLHLSSIFDTVPGPVLDFGGKKMKGWKFMETSQKFASSEPSGALDCSIILKSFNKAAEKSSYFWRLHFAILQVLFRESTWNFSVSGAQPSELQLLPICIYYENCKNALFSPIFQKI